MDYQKIEEKQKIRQLKYNLKRCKVNMRKAGVKFMKAPVDSQVESAIMAELKKLKKQYWALKRQLEAIFT